MKKNGIFTFKNLSVYPEITHGFSTAIFGDLKSTKFPAQSENLEIFLSRLMINKNQLVLVKQKHGNKVAVVGRRDGGKMIPAGDGLLTKEEGIYLGIRVADCLPIFFYDTREKVVGICHAGWKGTVEGIAKNTVLKMKALGSNPSDVIVGIGPHIKVCCYDISTRRVSLLRKKFGIDSPMIQKRNTKFYLDLTALNLKQLEEEGINREKIEVSPYCTFCGGEKFFSRRRLGKQNFPEMLGVIGVYK